MEESEFEQIVLEEWRNVPERFREHISNVALLIENEPSPQLRVDEHLTPEETLLGLYHGVPNSERGSMYGAGGVLPDTITLFKNPILAAAREETSESFMTSVKNVVRETIWHEVGHYFGLPEEEIHVREEKNTNNFL